MQCLQDPFAGHLATDNSLSAAQQILLRVLNPDFPMPTERAKDEPAGHQEGPEGFGNITEEDKTELLEAFVHSHCKPSRLKPQERLLHLQLGLRQATAAHEALLKG